MGFLDKVKEKLRGAAESDKLHDVAGKLDEKTGGKLGEAAEKVKDKLPTDKIPGLGDQPSAAESGPESGPETGPEASPESGPESSSGTQQP